MNSLRLTSWFRPYAPAWIRNLSAGHSLALTIALIAALPFVVVGAIGFIFWFIGHVLLSGHFLGFLLAAFLLSLVKG